MSCIGIHSDFYFESLSDAAYKYIAKEFMAVAERGNELMKLTQTEFKRIIGDSQLNVKREEDVWDVLLEWVNKEPKNRQNELVHLLPLVRFGLMDSKYFNDNVILLYIIILIITLIVNYHNNCRCCMQ